ncbi:DUF805 domain-containing protein [Ramlibacter sp. Leaf400]|uniref:DUF805 domain-containing protein n=1 Tax=Ramlibacter sp. Leaf400 TaxID=1736365 RepID=UPI0006F7230D|nr:DUF805 domain-containing protein [Ramlibacter sp. Leaf400]KQT14065.1 hypothetical protein ASG30_00310 [Ramlibacter sp. Leaf400]
MEDFKKAVKACLNKYADFNGRAARPEFWWFFLFQIGVYVVASMIHSLVYLLAVAGLLLPSVAVGIRRMHDIGKSGWWLLLGLVPVVGLVLLYFAAQPGQPGSNEYGAQPAEGEGTALAPGAQ